MSISISDLAPLAPAFLDGIAAALLSMAISRAEPQKRPQSAAAAAAAFGALFAVLPRAGWGLAAAAALHLLLGAAVWLLLRRPALYGAVTAVSAAVLTGWLVLLRLVLDSWFGWLPLLTVTALAALCIWRNVTILPETADVASGDRSQTRKLYFSAAAMLVVLSLLSVWMWYLTAAFPRLSPADRSIQAGFSTIFAVLAVLGLRRLAYGTAKQIEAMIDQRYQTELLNFMQVIRSQRHDFNFHIQAISGMIERREYQACDDYIHAMVKTANNMNDMLPLHHPAVSAMLNAFREMAVKKDISFDVSITNDLANIPCTIYEINTVIGNLIQNAVDELEEHKDLRRWIRVVIMRRGGNHVIIVTNPCHQDAGAFENCFRPGYTTKKSHEGIGLATVMRIVSKYHGLVFPEFEEDAISFVVQLACPL